MKKLYIFISFKNEILKLFEKNDAWFGTKFAKPPIKYINTKIFCSYKLSTDVYKNQIQAHIGCTKIGEYQFAFIRTFKNIFLYKKTLLKDKTKKWQDMFL